MCLLIVSPGGSVIDRERVREAAWSNTDGFGFAIQTDQRLFVGKGMNVETIMDWFDQIRSIFPSADALFHLRYTTHGKTNRDNCHPFAVAGRDDLVMAHNGILPIDVPKHDPRSDSRIFAEDWLSEWGVDCLNDDGFIAELGEWITYNKLCFLGSRDVLAGGLLIVNEGNGEWDDGCWWSNDSWKPYKPTKLPISTISTLSHATPRLWSWDDDKKEREHPLYVPVDPEQGYAHQWETHSCMHCYGETLVDMGWDAEDVSDRCEFCGACLWCGDFSEFCCQNWDDGVKEVGDI
jgi:glutamine amidotransferase